MKPNNNNNNMLQDFKISALFVLCCILHKCCFNARLIFSIGKDCWIQLSSRIMPATVMKRESRVLPGTLVLPGDTIEEGMVWGGLPAEPIGKR